MGNKIEINGANFWVNKSGSGECIIFLHGGLVSSRIWDDQMLYFSKSYTTLFYDQRGYGKSDLPEHKFSYYNDLKDIIDNYGFSSCVLVGSSFGGSVAIDFALEYPHYVKKLILVTPALNGFKYPLKMTFEIIKHAINIRKYGVDKAIELFSANSFWSYFVPQDSDCKKLFCKLLKLNENFYNGKQTLGQIAKPVAIKRLSEIETKTLLIRADLDSIFNKKVCDILENKMANIESVTINNCGHLPNIEKPEEINRIIENFIIPD